MNRTWRLYKGLCIVSFSILLAAALMILLASTFNDLLASPVATSSSPDGRLQLRVFSAGQGSLPPDYRAGVRFVLYDPTGLPGFRSIPVASAAFADGWSIRWTGPHAVTIEAGRLSQFDRTSNAAWGVTTTVHIADAPAEERDCIRQDFRNAIDGVTCFDGLLRRPAR